MLIAYAAAKRGPPVGRIRTAAERAGLAPRQQQPRRSEPTAAPNFVLRRLSALPSAFIILAYGNARQARWPPAAVSKAPVRSLVLLGPCLPRGRGHHSHGTARLVRREELQVFTPSSSAIPHDSCPGAPAQGGPAATLRPRPTATPTPAIRQHTRSTVRCIRTKPFESLAQSKAKTLFFSST